MFSTSVFSISYILGFITILAITLITLTILFKLGAAPFHNWSPDLYDSVPTHITAWMAIIVKVSILLFIAQSSIVMILHHAGPLFIITGILSLIVGAGGLSAQWRIKRFFAYSAISHLGFLLLAYASPQSGLDSFIYYLVIYGITSLGVFTILCILDIYAISPQSVPKSVPITSSGVTFINTFKTPKALALIEQLAGLYVQAPVLAWSLSFILLSFAGIPPMAGFFAKFSVLTSYLLHGF